MPDLIIRVGDVVRFPLVLAAGESGSNGIPPRLAGHLALVLKVHPALDRVVVDDLEGPKGDQRPLFDVPRQRLELVARAPEPRKVKPSEMLSGGLPATYFELISEDLEQHPETREQLVDLGPFRFEFRGIRWTLHVLEQETKTKGAKG
jgi:hypothetical protein